MLTLIASIFMGAALFATVALYFRWPMLVAYIVVGMLIGPFGVGWISNSAPISEIAEIGIMFLLFLLGLDMQPGKLARLFSQTAIVGALSCVLFFLFGMACALGFGFNWHEAWVIGAATMFSSTIVGIKLLPTTVLHHRHTGELMVSILLFQDFVAILLLALLHRAEGVSDAPGLGLTLLALPLLVVGCFLIVRFVLLPLIAAFDAFHEYIFLLAIGWCLGIATLSGLLGISAEIGAFIAGIALATSPIAQYISESLKPIRDFFLILFFFALGAGFNLSLLPEIWLPSVVLAVAVIVIKPPVFGILLHWMGEKKQEAWEVGWRLAQTSEFSLLIAYLATSASLIRTEASHVIQAVAILSFAFSTYLVVRRYPSPMAANPKLRRD